AMDLYDVATGYESEEEAYSRITAELLFVGVSSDWLFPASEVRDSAEKARRAGANSHYAEIDTLSGHDAFLKDWNEMREAIGPFVKDQEETR
ncbi:MAG: homoserine O-acetyltransferase, partial [Rubrobacteraceae bacterium]